MNNAVINCLLNHRSIRRFEDRPVPDEVVEQILWAGIRQATAGNLQLYSLIIVDDAEQKAALGVGHAPLAIAVLADQHRVRRWFAANGVDLADVDSAAPRNLFIAYWDAIIVLQGIVTAAESLGLGTCYYGGILSADARELFGAPEYTFPAGLVAIGWPAETPELSTRLPLQAVVHRGRYRDFSAEELHTLYEERDAVWAGLPVEQREQLVASGIDCISKGVARRKYSAEFLGERTKRLTANLQRSRFRLP